MRPRYISRLSREERARGRGSGGDGGDPAARSISLREALSVHLCIRAPGWSAAPTSRPVKRIRVSQSTMSVSVCNPYSAARNSS